MQVIKTEIPDLLIIEPKVFGDDRGWFVETYQDKRYDFIPNKFVQDNLSFSKQGTLRGLHIQKPYQGKLVQVIAGEIFDVAVDLRFESPTFGKWCGITLSSENKRQFWVPEGFAHGFFVLSETAIFAYKCTNYYSPKDEFTLLWDDPTVGIKWPICRGIPNGLVVPIGYPKLSEKDKHGLSLDDFVNKFK